MKNYEKALAGKLHWESPCYINETPRERDGSFEPQTVKKHETILAEGIPDYCADNGIGSPADSGIVPDRYLHGIPEDSSMAHDHFLKSDKLTPELIAYLQRQNGIATTRNETLAEMALAWILNQKGVTSFQTA